MPLRNCSLTHRQMDDCGPSNLQCTFHVVICALLRHRQTPAGLQLWHGSDLLTRRRPVQSHRGVWETIIAGPYCDNGRISQPHSECAISQPHSECAEIEASRRLGAWGASQAPQRPKMDFTHMWGQKKVTRNTFFSICERRRPLAPPPPNVTGPRKTSPLSRCLTRRHSIRENLVCFLRFALQKHRRREWCDSQELPLECRVGFIFLIFIIRLNNYLDPIFQDLFCLGPFLPGPFLPDRFYQDRHYLHPGIDVSHIRMYSISADRQCTNAPL